MAPPRKDRLHSRPPPRPPHLPLLSFPSRPFPLPTHTTLHPQASPAQRKSQHSNPISSTATTPTCDSAQLPGGSAHHDRRGNSTHQEGRQQGGGGGGGAARLAAGDTDSEWSRVSRGAGGDGSGSRGEEDPNSGIPLQCVQHQRRSVRSLRGAAGEPQQQRRRIRSRR